MITKVINKTAYAVEMWRDSEFLGYYSGGHHDGIAKPHMDLLKAEIYEKIERCEHMLLKLIRFNSEEYSFKMVECLETVTMTYFDQYDDRRKKGKTESKVYIRIKDKSDPLSEPGFLSEYRYNSNERSFCSTLDINKALSFGYSAAFSVCNALSKDYDEKYEFYRERFHLKKDKFIVVISKS